MTRIPTIIAVMAAALAASLLLVGLDALGFVQGIHEWEVRLVEALDFPALVMQGMLSLLLFAGSLHLDVDALRLYRVPIAALAFGSTLASTLLVGGATWWLLDAVGVGIPPIDAMLFGALISPTDPIAVLGILKSARAPRALTAVIAGESLFNDGVAVVLFSVLIEMRTEGATPSAAHAASVLLQEVGGGLLFGWLLGGALSWVLSRARRPLWSVPITFASVVGGYALANALGMSGPLAMVVAGLVVASGGRRARRENTGLERFWEFVDEALNVVLFLLVGAEVVVVHFPGSAMQAAVACIITTAVVLVARGLTAGLPVYLGRGSLDLPAGSSALVVWGGLRGGLSLAMALSLPVGATRETIVALTYATVAFAVLVQGLTFGRLVKNVSR